MMRPAICCLSGTDRRTTPTSSLGGADFGSLASLYAAMIPGEEVSAVMGIGLTIGAQF